MGKAYSMDLRERVVRAVEDDGFSRRRAARRFGVAESTAINWVRRFRETGTHFSASSRCGRWHGSMVPGVKPSPPARTAMTEVRGQERRPLNRCFYAPPLHSPRLLGLYIAAHT